MYDLYGEDTKTKALKIIKTCQDKIQVEEKKIEECNFNIDTYKLRMINNIRGLYVDISEKTLETVWHGFYNKPTDKEELKTYKSKYDYIVFIIKEHIIGDTKCSYKKKNFIEDIVVCGFDRYAYNITFIVNDIKFLLEVPVVKNVSLDNYMYGCYGQYWLGYYSSEYYRECIKTSYELDDIKKAFKEFIEKDNNNG